LCCAGGGSKNDDGGACAALPAGDVARDPDHWLAINFMLLLMLQLFRSFYACCYRVAVDDDAIVDDVVVTDVVVVVWRCLALFACLSVFGGCVAVADTATLL
jgi:hypothetical protein